MSEICEHETFKDICGICHRDTQITALRAEVVSKNDEFQKYAHRMESDMNDLGSENARLTARIRKLEEALAMGIYEATHLSPQEPDGSHWAKISSDFLATARAALRAALEEKT